ncbi:MAG: LysM peptidoglycan-binding domain-containing protein [Spirochaetes bacterium]|nr:LysM peptidoglycan-binding domain-containing protein [Spirochaetota bacterium]
MKRRKNLILLLVSVTCAIFISSCEVDVPIKEMAAARNGIEDAKKYDAEKYAPNEIKNAEELLIQSHKKLVDGNTDDARKSANDAILAANNAKNKSLQPYADSKIKQSGEMYDLAEKAYAEKFSPDNFEQGKNFNSEAKSQYEQGDYIKSVELAEKSSALFTTALNDSLQNSSSISNEISSTEKKLAEIKRDKNSNAAASNLTKAENSIKNARKAFDGKDFKTSWREIDSAKKELDAASIAINKQRISASIAEMRTDIKGMQAGGLAQDITSDLDSATSELNGAELSLGQNNIKDADARVIRAADIVNNAKFKIKKNEAVAALNKAENQLAQARNKDRDKKYYDNLNKAENLIKSGKSLVTSGKFNDAINNADEAESIINAALNSMENDAQNMAVSSGDDNQSKDGSIAANEAEDTKADDEDGVLNDPNYKPAQGKTYIVQWRKKDTDCLWKISLKVYKDASFWPAIFIANKDQIKNPDLIFPGQRLIIPPKPAKKPLYKKN